VPWILRQVGLQAVVSALCSLVRVVICSIRAFPGLLNAPLVGGPERLGIPEEVVQVAGDDI